MPSGEVKRMGPPDLFRYHQALHQTSELLEARQFEYALAGGLAVAVWGTPRATFDVDLVVACSVDQVDRVCLALRQEGAFLFDPEILAFPSGLSIVRGHAADRTKPEPDVIVVDFLLPEKSFAKAVVQRRVPVNLAGRQIWVCSPE